MFGIIIIAYIEAVVIYFVHGKTREPGGLPSFSEGLCCPCWIVLHSFQGKTKIAATTAIVTADALR